MMDLMSSPDPLNASLEDSAFGPSRRVTRSQTSQASSRLSSVNPSPRKQTFALDVGNASSPQKIIVTVEADDTDARSTNVKRKLFQSPTPKRIIRRREKATTTTVPLKGMTDDESGAPSSSAATPKRRGRPPKSGTPAATTRKRATPIRKTPRQPRQTKPAEVPTSDITVEDNDDTPKATRAKRPTTSTKRKTLASGAGETPQPKRRGRRRRSLTVEEIQVLAGDAASADAEVEDNTSVAQSEDNLPVAGSVASVPPLENEVDEEEDIWMATLSDPPSRFSKMRSSRSHQEQSVSEQDQEQPPSEAGGQAETEGSVSDANAGYDFGADGNRSETGSLVSDVDDKSGDKDTIMVQEEFTMISLHSLPSMQGNLSIAAREQQELGEETSLIINQTLESLRHSRNASENQTMSSEPEDEVSFVGPQAEEENTPRSTNNSLFAHSPPGRSWARSPRRAKTLDLGRQLAVKSLQKQQGPASPQRLSPNLASTSQDQGEPNSYDDSFSEIPEAVLEAATPKPLRRAISEHPDEEEDAAPVQSSIERRRSKSNPPQPQSESRLLTPDETPSPLESEADGDKDPERAAKSQQLSEMQSSPPVFNISQREQSASVIRHSRRASSETPVIQAPSEDAAPPRIQDGGKDANSLAPPESVPRPTLSPIVRAGRALQFVTSDPPSPAIEKSLGSPFRSSVGSVGSVRKSPAPQAAVQVAPTPSLVVEPTPAFVPAQEAPVVEPELQNNSPWTSALAPFKQIKNLVAQGAQAFSPRTAPKPAVEDPFVESQPPSPTGRQDTLTMHNSMFTLGGGSVKAPTPAVEDPFVEVHAVSPSRRQDTLSMHNSMFNLGGRSMTADRPVSRTSSVQAEIAYEDEMSWQVDGTPVRFNERAASASSTMRGRRGSMTEVNEMSDVEMDMESFVEESFVQHDGDDDEQDEEPEQDDGFEDDIWAIEAQRPTPGRPQPKAIETEPVLNPPRRSKLPSPWRQNSKRLVYNDELHKLSETANPENEEFSLLSQLSKGSAAETVVQPPRPAKVDLSAFFSSPALLPEVQPFGMGFPKPSAEQHTMRQPENQRSFSVSFSKPVQPSVAKQPETQPAGEPQDQPRGGLLSVSRKIFSFGGRTQQANVVETPALPSVPQKELRLGDKPRVDLFSPLKRPATREGAPGPEPAEHSSSPSTPPRQLFAHVPQKRNFTPRSRQAGNSLFDPVSKPADEPEAESDHEHEISAVSHDESSFVVPELKPLPARQRSPTKSCIRSPLKAKTPGRVVEFTSSTLSPLAQAQARAEMRASTGSRGGDDKIPQMGDGNKENQSYTEDVSVDHDIHHSMSSTAPQKPSLFAAIPHLPPPKSATLLPKSLPRLSPTNWTRSHWERLDALLQERRRVGALAFQLAHPVAKNGTKPRLLGKQVVAQGETMTLEQWHIDVVDAFAAEIGGAADERVLAKRVFALLVGEERRRNGLVPRRRGGEVVV